MFIIQLSVSQFCFIFQQYIMKRTSIVIDKRQRNSSPNQLNINFIKQQPQFSFTNQKNSSLYEDNILQTSQVLQTQILNLRKQGFALSQVQKESKFYIMETIRADFAYKQMIKNKDFMEDIQSILNLQALNLTEIFLNFFQVMKKIILFNTNSHKQKVISTSRDERIKLKITQTASKLSKKDSKLEQQNKRIKLQNFRIKQSKKEIQLQILKLSEQFKKKKERYKAQIQKLTDILQCSFMEAGKKFIEQQFIQVKPKSPNNVILSKKQKIIANLVQAQLDSDIQKRSESQKKDLQYLQDYNFNILKAKNATSQLNTAKSQVINLKKMSSQHQNMTKQNYANQLRYSGSNIFQQRYTSEVNKLNSADKKSNHRVSQKLDEKQSQSIHQLSHKNSVKTMKISKIKSEDQNQHRLSPSPKFGKVYASQLSPYN